MSTPQPMVALPCGSLSISSTLRLRRGERRGKIDGGGRLADAALLVRHRDDALHGPSSIPDRKMGTFPFFCRSLSPTSRASAASSTRCRSSSSPGTASWCTATTFQPLSFLASSSSGIAALHREQPAAAGDQRARRTGPGPRPGRPPGRAPCRSGPPASRPRRAPARPRRSRAASASRTCSRNRHFLPVDSISAKCTSGQRDRERDAREARAAADVGDARPRRYGSTLRLSSTCLVSCWPRSRMAVRFMRSPHSSTRSRWAIELGGLLPA